MIPEEIENFYKSLNNLKSLNIWNINREISILENIDESWKDKIIAERKVLTFNLNKGELNNNFTSTDINGKKLNLPTFTASEIDYLKERLEQAKNPWLIARYAQLLWQLTKNNKYGEIAIIHYLENLRNITPDEARELPQIFSATFYISKKTKLKISEIKDVALMFINNFPNWIKFAVLESIFENNIFQKSELVSIADSVLDWIRENNTTSYLSNKSYLSTAVLLFNKIGRPLEKIYELLAENEDLILQEHTDDKDFLKLTATGTKADYHKLAKDMVNYELTMKEYNRLKQTVKLSKITIELDDEHTRIFNEYLSLQASAILKLSPDMLLAFFACSEDILVDPNENKLNAEKTFNNSIHSLYSTSVFDINTNFKKLKDADKLNFEIIKSYSISFNIKFHALFFKVFVEGIMLGKINFYHIYEFLEKNTWYGIKFKRSATSNEIDEETSWITMIAPGIHNFIAQFEFLVLMNNNKISNFILAIDSLTLKFEGALRDFIRLSGGSTTVRKKGELQEQLLEELLDNPVTTKYFSEKDIELFKYTFTKKGKNIRNHVAHCFMEFSDYSLQTASMVFFCLLRLGKYTFEE